MHKFRILSFVFGMSILILGCLPNSKYVYLTNPKNNPSMDSVIRNVDIFEVPEHIIGESDLLKVAVSPDGMPMNSQILESGVREKALDEFMVDAKGNLNLPLIGKIHVSGLTMEQLQTLLHKEYSKTYTNPSVYLAVLSFRISIIGEVPFGGVKRIEGDHINIFEAIANAGDLTDNSKRYNVKLLRKNSQGKMDMYPVDFSSREIFKSPGFHLQSNDIVYVEPYHRKRVLDITQKVFFLVTTLNVFSTIFFRYF